MDDISFNHKELNEFSRTAKEWLIFLKLIFFNGSKVYLASTLPLKTNITSTGRLRAILMIAIKYNLDMPFPKIL